MQYAVETADLVKEFRTADGSVLRAVDRVTLKIRPGQVLGLVGEAGAGKSTLLRLIGGQYRPTRGWIRADQPLLLFDEPDLGQQIPADQTALVATRHLDLALALCQEIALMHQGRVLPARSRADVAAALPAVAPSRVRIRGHLPQRWAASLHGVSITNLPHGECLLEGQEMDQAALHGLLNRLRDLGLPLLSVTTSPAPKLPDLLAAWSVVGDAR